jgi:aryl-alcohol dehydrogenase-like predicted oxidoreductase
LLVEYAHGSIGPFIEKVREEIKMEYRRLGSSGLKISAIGLGTNQFGGKVGRDEAARIIHTALDEGINFIDTADVYKQGKSEEAIGAAIEGRRLDVVIATKVRHPIGDGPNQRGASRLHILEGVEASLRRLKTDFIDLYQIHRWDEESPIEETLRTLDDLVRSGKVRYIGASNFSAWQLAHAITFSSERGWEKFVSIQPHYHMLERGIEAELLPACQYLNIGVLPYFPLAGGFLTGKYRAGEPAPPGSRGESSSYVQGYQTSENYARLEKLENFTKERGRTLNDLAHAWLLAQPQVNSVISGATKPEQVRSNAAASGWRLSKEELGTINAVLEG